MEQQFPPPVQHSEKLMDCDPTPLGKIRCPDPMYQVMNRAVFAVSALLIAAVLAGVSAMVYLRTGPAAMRTSGTALVGGPFQLTSHTGAQVTDQQFRGRHMLVFFGYTYCPDVCPAGLQVMTSALEKLGPAADSIQPLFITVDPERDTVPVLASYMENFHPRLIGLTGSLDDIAKTAQDYRVYFKKAGDTSGEDYLMDHSSILYLMGPNGEFVKHFSYGSDVAILAEGLRKALGSN